MFDLHIGDFFGDAAKTILTLYRRFPVKSTLYVEDICGPDSPDEFGLHSPRHTACFSCILWLAEENYIRFSQPMQQEAFEEVVLTQECFLHFSKPIQTDNSPRTLVSDLEDIVQHKSSNDLEQFMLSQMVHFSK